MHTKTLGSRKSSHKIKAKGVIKIILIGFLLLLLGIIIWIFNVKPITLQSKLGGKIAAVEWNTENGDSAEALAQWTIKKTYPGGINKEEKAICVIKNVAGKTLAEVTFYPKDNLILIDEQAYIYQMHPEDTILLQLSRKLDELFLK